MRLPFQFLRRIGRQGRLEPRRDEEVGTIQKAQSLPEDGFSEQQVVSLARHPSQWVKIRSVRTRITSQKRYPCLH
jgi:hypothetical protein